MTNVDRIDTKDGELEKPSCKCNGVLGKHGKYSALCGSIGVGSNTCHYKGDCEHQQWEKNDDSEQ